MRAGWRLGKVTDRLNLLWPEWRFMTDQIPVVVAGALGRMGAEVIKAVHGSGDCQLVGAVDTCPGREGEDVGEALGLGELEVALSGDFEGTLCLASQQHPGAVLVDFTHPRWCMSTPARPLPTA